MGRGRSPDERAALVDEPAMGDGEHPRSEARLVAPEPAQVAEHGDEDLAAQDVGLDRALGAQVTDHDGRQRHVDALERFGRAALRRPQHLLELPIEPIDVAHGHLVVVGPPRKGTAPRGTLGLHPPVRLSDAPHQAASA